MNLLRNFSLAMTIMPVVIAAGCNGGGSASSTSSTSTTSSQPSTTTSNLAITSPAAGASVSSPFTLTATATTCDSQTVTSIGYVLDSGSTYTTTNGTALSAQVTATAGAHTVSVVATGSSGATCNASTTFTVTASTTGSDLAISSPASGATVTSPFTLKASATTCDGQSIASIGYSIDTGSTTVLSGSSSIDASVTAAAGAHTVYVKAWGSSGAECDANVAITVSAPATTTTSSNSPVPSNATTVSNIEELSTWKENHDPATGSSSSGTMSMVSAPSPVSTLNATAREFNTSYTGSGGEIYYVSWGADTAPMNFFWDGWVYINSSISSVANLELDMNQVISNGDTIIYGFQCDGYSGTWDYTENAGTVTATSAHWLHSSAACDVRSWAQNTWHHVQIYYSRDDNGNVTYHSVWLDGNEAQINETVPSAFGLGWGTTLLTNFQIDGLGSGSNTIYLDNLTISRW
jgi:Bacterial Ig domain